MKMILALIISLSALLGGTAPASAQLKLDPNKLLGKGSGLTELQEVTVDGEGETERAALLDAYRNAVTQVVGQYTSGWTKLDNDKLDEQILIHAKGVVKKWTKVKEWEEDGLYYVTIKASVSRNRLAKQLYRENLKFDGELVYAQAENNEHWDETAATILVKELAAYGPDRFMKAKVVGEPQVKKTDDQYTLSFNVELKADMKKWLAFQRSFAAVLRNVKAKRGTKLKLESKTYNSSYNTPIDFFKIYNLNSQGGDVRRGLKKHREELKEKGVDWSYYVVLMKNYKNIGPRKIGTEWETYHIVHPLPNMDSLLKRKYAILLALTSDNGDIIATEKKDMTGGDYEGLSTYQKGELRAGYKEGHDSVAFDEYWFGPCFFGSRHRFDVNFAHQLTVENVEITLSEEELTRVKNATAVIQEIDDE